MKGATLDPRTNPAHRTKEGRSGASLPEGPAWFARLKPGMRRGIPGGRTGHSPALAARRVAAGRWHAHCNSPRVAEDGHAARPLAMAQSVQAQDEGVPTRASGPL